MDIVWFSCAPLKADWLTISFLLFSDSMGMASPSILAPMWRVSDLSEVSGHN